MVRARGRPKQYIPNSFEITPGETLDGKDWEEFTSDVIRARFDPIWFMKEKLKWESIFPMQEKVIREFYQDKYDSNLQEYKKLIIKAGQRCISKTTRILTLEYGNIEIKDLFIIFNKGNKITVRNEKGWVSVENVWYTSYKCLLSLIIDDNKSIKCSYEHKFYINNEWKEAGDIKVGDTIRCYDEENKDFYEGLITKINIFRGLGETYDLHVPNGNSYVANGILSHNSGKTVLGSKIAAYEFFELATCSFEQTPSEYYGLMKNQPICINCVSAGKEQALMGIFSLMRNDIEQNEWFNQWFNIRVTENKIEILEKNIYSTISAAKADSGAGTGTTAKSVFGDEVDLWQRTDSKIGAEIAWSKMVNSTQTLKLDGKCIAISSTQYPDGMITRLYNSGLNEKTTLTYEFCTWEFNPNITSEELLEEYKFSTESFWKDFANQPEISGGLQFPEKVKLDKTLHNVLQLDFYNLSQEHVANLHKVTRVMSIDPAWRNDSFGIGCGYTSPSGNIIIDGVRKFMKTSKNEEYIKPSDIRNFIIPAMECLNVNTLVYDVDLMPELVEHVSDNLGKTTIKHIVTKEDYDRWRELQEEGSPTKLRVVYDEFLEKECNQLIVQTTQTGKRKTTHTKYSSDDVSDTVANCIWYLQAYKPEITFVPYLPMRYV